jgi:predicted nucleic acid-binding protein
MDYADASLVALADALGSAEIFSTDRRGFSVYRSATGKRFRLVTQGDLLG